MSVILWRHGRRGPRFRPPAAGSGKEPGCPRVTSVWGNGHPDSGSLRYLSLFFPFFFFFTLNLPQRQSSPMKTLWFRHTDTWHPTGLRSQLLSLETAVFQAPRLEGGLPPSRRGGVRVCSVPGSGSASGAPRHGQGAVGRRSRAGRAHRASAGFPSCRRMPRPSLRGAPGSRGLGEELVDECTVKGEAGKTVKAGESGGCRSAVASWAQLTASSQVQKDP